MRISDWSSDVCSSDLHIMQRYLQLASVNALADELNAQGYRTKLQRRTSGPHRGGCSFRRGTLYHLLSNRIYIGDIIHKGRSEEHTSELQSLMRISYAVFCLKKKKNTNKRKQDRLRHTTSAITHRHNKT